MVMPKSGYLPLELESASAILAVIDVQSGLAKAMDPTSFPEAVHNMARLAHGFRAANAAIMVTEQYPKGLGATVPELADALAGAPRFEKIEFSAYANPAFAAALDGIARRQVVLVGMETHICVYQTARALVRAGYAVQVVADAVVSRAAANRAIGLDLCRNAGAVVTCTETVLFDLVKVAKGDVFKTVSKLVK